MQIQGPERPAGFGSADQSNRGRKDFMSEGMPVYIGVKGATVPEGSTALDALRAINPDEADEVAAGACVICDSRGLPIPPETPAYAGAIFRVVRNRSAAALEEE
jgi:hypothetical protein